MIQKLFLRILLGIFTLALLFLFVTKVVVEPWIGRKIQTAINKSNKDYVFEIGNVTISIWKSGLELENIILRTKPELKGIGDLKGEVASIRIEGIKLIKAIFTKDIDIREVTIFNSRFKGSIPFPEKPGPPKISTLNIRIDSIFLDRTNVEIRNTTNSEAVSLKDGVLKVYDLKVDKLDTFSTGIIQHFDFDTQELNTVSPDSMYAFTATGVNYSAHSTILKADSFSVHPNYTESEFTDRHEFQTDRVEAGISRISFRGISAADYLKPGNLISSYIEIGELEMKVFRDKRKEFRHIEKPMLQDMLANFPGKIDIDSIGILSGNITYKEHAEKANEPGVISFNHVNVRIYKVTNDTIYKTEKASMKFKAEALLMDKGKLSVILEAAIFDRNNTFSIDGSLSGMEVNELNPMLEKNAFIYATSGKIDQMNFNFTANKSKATGQMKLLYHRLDIAVKNKRTDDTTAIKERFMSLIGNTLLVNSNPIPGQAVRTGIIDYQRDPERFIFGYCFKSILSGIKTSITKSPRKKGK